ncbi:FAD-dependent oxidoreductase [Aromatoleum toluvorans]|uniref:FAD-dependent oxidoreductase n=1 Tax=Aromatoleum toluvorans TaxID=92002 RepID=A0ABX1Q332_9RHOO|nr:FAD-dependent oxidoreductase [Aromatoleum toluvorans]
MTERATYPSYQASSGWNALLPPRQPRTRAPHEKHFEAVVIGAGVTGLAAARRIAELEPNARVLVIDSSTIGEGSSGRNSGFLINLPHNTGMSGHGSPVEIARKQIRLYNEGTDWLKSLVDRYAIDCGWNPAGKYHAAATADGERRLQEALSHYREWGVPYRELDQDELQSALGTRYYRYGYHSDTNIFVQPAALVRGLADNLPTNVTLWENEPVQSLSRRKPFRIRTRSRTLSADRVVIANNGFASKLGFARDRVFTIYTYAALTPELPAEELAKLGVGPEWGVIPANRLGSTLRRTGSGRFMVRSAYSYESEQSIARVRSLLQDCYRRRFPNMRAFDFEHVWGGVTALTRNGAVYFGRVEDGLYISLGCNGAGMIKGTMFGKLLGEMACDAQSPQLADALGFERPTWLPPEPIRRLAVVTAINYQKYRAGIER